MKYILSFLPLYLLASQVPTQQITFHATEDLTINITGNNPAPEISQVEAQEVAVLRTCNQRLLKNRTALIAAGATLSSGALSGIIALIVHFTQSS